MSDSIDAMALNLVPGLGPARRRVLLEALGPEPGAILDAGPRLGQFAGSVLPGPARAALADPAGLRRLAVRELEAASRLGVRSLTLAAPDYPCLLREIVDPPPIIGVLGTISAEADACAVAIVGARRASHYGLRVARVLATGLARSGVTVISGLARGIDAAAHGAALDAGGRTLAVLGSGHGRVYPAEHRRLAQEIAGQGAVLSEFPIDAPPRAHHFPMRNRLVAGLSLGVVVVEAAQRSGALITARLAMEEGREVGAVPGPVDEPRSEGTNALLADGAVLVRSAEDVVEAIRELREIRDARAAAEKAELAPLPAPRPSGLPGSDVQVEQALLECLSCSHPLHVAELTQLSQCAGPLVVHSLMMLRLAGRVREEGPDHYVLES